MPKEHGAYAQVLLPLVTGACLGRPTAVSLLLAVAVVLAFSAHEPLLVALGWRGVRARREAAPGLRARVGGLLAAALLAGAVALVLASNAVRLATLPALVPAVVYAALVVRSREKTLLKDLLVSAAFSATALPVGLAVGGTPAAAVIAAAVWLVTFGLQTLAVKGTIAAGKKRAPSTTLVRITWILSLVTTVAAVVAAVVTSRPGVVALAVLPGSLLALVLSARPVAARHLRRVGWSLVVVDAVALLALVVWLPRGA